MLIRKTDVVSFNADERSNANVNEASQTKITGQEAASPKQLLAEIDSAHSALEAQLNTLRAQSRMNLPAELEANAAASLRHLNLLRDQLVGGANAVPLAVIRAEVSAAIAAALAYTSDTRAASAATGTVQANPLVLREASEAAHRAVEGFVDDYYKNRVFDPYLRFASAEDDDAYRRREQERQEAIQKALGEDTPEGNLRANKLAIEQLKDAGAHGADRSPQYRPHLDDLLGTKQNLEAQVAAKDKKNEAQDRAAITESSTVPSTGDMQLSADIIAKVKNAGIKISDAGEGHGLHVRDARSSGTRPLPG